jgi:hypothetical protein
MRWKSRSIAFTLCFVIGFAAAAIFGGRLWEFLRRQQTRTSAFPCLTDDSFDSPEEVLAALKSPEVSVRVSMLNRLLLRPDVDTIYYDYQRDLNYPERADRARLQYIQLDESPEPEALLTFVRFEHPIAIVFKKKSCGWQSLAVVSSWLRFEDYPYENWLSLPEAIEPGVHQLLIRDSYGDSSSYVRKARLLRLNGDALTQVAEIEEEAIEPVRGYDGADWSDLKHHRINRYKFAYERAGESANIVNEVTEEVIKLNGAAPRYSYWLETDGSWHARESNWSRRPAARMYLLGISTEVLIWNSQEGRFVQS